MGNIKNIFRFHCFSVLFLIIILSGCRVAEISAPKEIFCGAETMTEDKMYFVSPYDSTDKFRNDDNRSRDHTHSGYFSVKLTKDKPYGLTYKIKDVKKGDRYQVSVWRYGKDDTGELVVSDNTAKRFYVAEKYAFDRDYKGWDMLNIIFTVPSDMENEDLNVFVWNSGEDTVYFDDLHIIRLPDKGISFDEIYCNAEKLSENGKYFFSPFNRMIRFQDNNNQTGEQVHSGKYSVLLTEDQPFGMTYELKKVKKGDRYHASIWRYAKNNNGILIAADKTSEDLYITGERVFRRESSGWELLKIDFVIPKKLHNKNIKIYAWNEGGQPVFFDDLKIVKVTGEKDIPLCIHCDAEHLSPDGQSFVSRENNMSVYGNAKYRTDERSHSGKYSVKLTKDSQYGLSYKIKNVKKDEYYRISVWRYSNNNKGFIVASDKTSGRYYVTGKRMLEKKDNGWELLNLDIEIPPHIHNEDITIFAWNPGDDPVYFDDLRIERYNEKPYPVYNTGSLEIYIDADGMKKMMLKREEAFEKGILETGDNDWVKAIISWEGKENKAEVRLKGDWLDHLHGRKWSLRIKMKKDGAWKNMRNFSIQTPISRDFLNEWVFHELLRKEDILTTRYGFIPVEINGENVGIYAYEEHFEKHLPESNNRREGPILKFAEEGFWKLQQKNLNADEKINLPVFEASDIVPFKINRTMSSSELFNRFLLAQNKLYNYKFGKIPVCEAFDPEDLARYYALINIAKAYHCLMWHNQRYYYDPVMSRLEPVAFDCYTHDGIFNLGKSPIFGDSDLKLGKIRNDLLFLYLPFMDTAFVDHYIRYLEKFSENNYISNFFSEIKEKGLFYESQIRKEYPYYEYDTLFYFENAGLIRESLPGFKMRVEDNKLSAKIEEVFNYTSEYYDNIEDTSFLPYLVRAYKSTGTHTEHNEVSVINYWPEDIFLSGTGETKDSVDYYFEKEYKSPSFYRTKENVITVNSSGKCKYLFYKTEGYDTVFSVSINPWRLPGDPDPLQELMENSGFPVSKYYRISSDSMVIFNKGSYEIDENMIIPAGYIVKFEPGTEINMVNGSMILSYSPLLIMGEKANPVIIRSGDGTSMGITVLQAKGMSVIDNAIFDQLSALDYKGWTLTGALNFYESGVTIRNTVFKNNRCEDALSIIRSEFEINNCEFDNIFYDAFDSDFSTGNVSNTVFRDIANDAMDFSGSNVIIDLCKVLRAGDKGISGGENSDIIINNTLIEDSKVGIASKDLSVIKVVSSKISNCDHGFIALKKKPEYGPATIIVNSADMINVIFDYYIEKDSELILNGKTIPGDKKNVAKKFYVD